MEEVTKAAKAISEDGFEVKRCLSVMHKAIPADLLRFASGLLAGLDGQK